MANKRVPMSDREFNALVDEEFAEASEASGVRKNRTDKNTWRPSDELMAAIEADGADPRLTRGAARLHGALARCFGSTHGQPLSDESVKFLNDFDLAAREWAAKNGIKLR